MRARSRRAGHAWRGVCVATAAWGGQQWLREGKCVVGRDVSWGRTVTSRAAGPSALSTKKICCETHWSSKPHKSGTLLQHVPGTYGTCIHGDAQRDKVWPGGRCGRCSTRARIQGWARSHGVPSTEHGGSAAIVFEHVCAARYKRCRCSAQILVAAV